MLGAVENTRIQPNGYQTKQKTYIARYCILDLPPLFFTTKTILCKLLMLDLYFFHFLNTPFAVL